MPEPAENTPPETSVLTWQSLKQNRPLPVKMSEISSVKVDNTLSVLLGPNASVQLSTRSRKLVEVYHLTIHIPYIIKTSETTFDSVFVEMLRGVISKDEGSRVLICADLNGKNHIKEFIYGHPYDNNFDWEFVNPLPDLEDREYVLSLFILVERRNSNTHVLVEIDSLDIYTRFNNK